MQVCNKCGKSFDTWVTIDNKKHNLSSRKYCLDCSPFMLHNTTKLEEEQKKTIKFCKYCGEEIGAFGNIYCSLKCQHDAQYQEYIDKWKRREINGIKGKNGQLSNRVRRYIFEKFDSKCTQCGWSEVNPFTGTIPLEVEHIDGNWENSYEENLNLLCPNCHSLTATYRGANRGNGRNITWIVKDLKIENDS